MGRELSPPPAAKDPHRKYKSAGRILRNMKEEKFALAYALRGEDGGKAALEEAGYAAGSGWRRQVSILLARDAVARRVVEHRDAIANKATTAAAVTREWIRDELVDNVRRAKSAVAVLDSHGQPTGEWKCDLPSSNRSLELLGKEQAMFTDKVLTEDLDRALSGKTPGEIEDVLKALILEIGPQTIERYLAEHRNESGGASPGAAGDEKEEAGAVPAVPEASGLSSNRILQ